RFARPRQRDPRAVQTIPRPPQSILRARQLAPRARKSISRAVAAALSRRKSLPRASHSLPRPRFPRLRSSHVTSHSSQSQNCPRQFPRKHVQTTARLREIAPRSCQRPPRAFRSRNSPFLRLPPSDFRPPTSVFLLPNSSFLILNSY